MWIICGSDLGKYVIVRFSVVPRDPKMTLSFVWSSRERLVFSVELSCLCEAVERGKMFRLSSDSLLSIMPNVWCTKVFTHKFLRNKKDFSVVEMVGRLELSISRKLDDVVGKKMTDNQSVIVITMFKYFTLDVMLSITCNVLSWKILFIYYHLWLAYPYLFVVCVMIIWYVCYTGAGYNTNASNVGYIDKMMGWTQDSLFLSITYTFSLLVTHFRFKVSWKTHLKHQINLTKFS